MIRASLDEKTSVSEKIQTSPDEALSISDQIRYSLNGIVDIPSQTPHNDRMILFSDLEVLRRIYRLQERSKEIGIKEEQSRIRKGSS